MSLCTSMILQYSGTDRLNSAMTSAASLVDIGLNFPTCQSLYNSVPLNTMQGYSFNISGWNSSIVNNDWRDFRSFSMEDSGNPNIIWKFSLNPKSFNVFIDLIEAATSWSLLMAVKHSS